LNGLVLLRNFTLQPNSMKLFKIVPISAAYAARIKANGKDDYGHPVIQQTARGLGPCRVSLQPFQKGVDQRLLITHSPFTIDNAYNQPGPVFINSEAIEEYQDIHRFPPAIKANKKSFPLTLIGYSKDQMMVHMQLVGDADVDELIPEIFQQYPEVEFLHARNAQAGCFICKIERINEGD
jgi:hypothetical protein